jgi:hypothetical protein
VISIVDNCTTGKPVEIKGETEEMCGKEWSERKDRNKADMARQIFAAEKLGLC